MKKVDQPAFVTLYQGSCSACNSDTILGSVGRADSRLASVILISVEKPFCS